MSQSFIPYGKQDISQQDIDAVVETLTSDFLTQGPKIPAFEQRIASICEVKYACAVSSATAALHIACLAAGLKQGDILWTSPVTFVASANVGLYCGATVDFVDIDERTGLMCPNKLEEKLKQAKAANRLPKVIIPVHLCGQSCDMEAIHKLCKPYDITIIEDASHAIGAKYQRQPVGICRYSDISVFSFHPVKIITTAEGGIATTNNQQLADKMARLRTHGITRDESLYDHQILNQNDHGPWYYQQVELGFNYRITDLQAALGLSQCDKLEDIIKKRHQLVNRYNQLISESPLQSAITTLAQLPDNYSAYHLYVIQTDNTTLNRRVVFDYLRKHNIGVNVHYIPVHLQPYYQQLGFKPGDFKASENYYSRAITLPLFPQMTEQQQNFVLHCIEELL